MEHKKIKMRGIEIDEGISELIQTLWDNNIETIQCCEGGYLKDKTSRFTYKEDGKIIENAHIIFYNRDLERIKKYLPEETEYIIGDKLKVNKIEEWLGAFNGVWANFKHK